MKLSLRPSSSGQRWLFASGIPSFILLLAFALRIFRLGDANLWWDEALAVWGIRKGLLGVTLWTAGDVHPPLYFWSLWTWVQVVGESEFAMRALTVVFGVLTVAVVYGLGCLLAGRYLGCLAAMLTALARFHVWWSQEMRMYALAGLAGTLSLYLFLRWLSAFAILRTRRDRSEQSSPRLLLALCTLCSIGALYTILLMGTLVVVENLVVIVAWLRPPDRHRRLPLGSWIVSQAVILLALVAWLLFSWGRMSTWSVAASVSPLFVLQLYATLLTTGISVDIGRHSWAALLPLAVLALAGCMRLRAMRRSNLVRGPSSALGALTLVLMSALPVGTIYYATMPRGLFYSPRIEARYFLPFAPSFWLLLSWACVYIAQHRRTLAWASAGVVIGMWLVYLPGHYSDRILRDPLQTMVRAIISQAEPGDAVLLDSGGRYPLFLYYYDRFPAEVWRPPMLKVPPDGSDLEADRVAQTLMPLVQSHRRLWLAEVEVNLSDPERLAAEWLRGHYHEVLALRYGYNALYLYDPEARAPLLSASSYQPQHLVNAPVGVGGILWGWELPVTEYTAGDVAHISLLWHRLPQQSVLLSVRNRRGQVLAAFRPAPAPGQVALRQQFDLPIYASTPAGDYDLVLDPAPTSAPVLGTLRVVRTKPLPRAGPPAVALDARLLTPTGEQVAILGYTLRNPRGGTFKDLRPGDQFILDLYWRSEDKLSRNYTVFTHLLGSTHNPKTQGPVWAQHDSQPANDGYPTTQWLEGQEVVDRHVLAVGEQAPAGVYRLEVGMYTVEDGQRLPVTAANGQVLGDHLLLETIVEVVLSRSAP